MSKDYSKLVKNFIEQDQNQKQGLARTNYEISYPISPEQGTKQYEISNSTNLPIDLVRRNEDELYQKTEVNSIDWNDLGTNYPKVLKQVQDAKILPAIKDDIKTLSNFERIVNSTKEKFQQSALMDETVDIRLKRMGFEATGNQSYQLSPTEQSQIASFEQAQPKDYNLNWVQSVIPESVAGLRTMYGTTKRSLPTIGVGGTVGYIAGLALTKNPAMAMATARITGGRTAAASAFYQMAKLETAGAFDELRTVVDENGQPLEKSIAAGASIATGTINGILELIPVKLGLDTLKKSFSRQGVKQLMKNEIIKEYAGNIAKGLLSEGSTEAIQEFSNVFFQEVSKAVSSGDFEVLGMKDINDIEGLFKFGSELASRVGQSFYAGSAGGAGISVIGGGAIATKRVYDNRKINEREQSAINEILDTAKQSNTLKRSSKVFKDATSETLGEMNIYIPAEQFQTYFQDKPDQLASFYANAPVRDQIEEALDTGGNIVVKGNDLATAIKDNPELESLKEYFKLSPESFTSLEAQDEFFQNVVPAYLEEDQTRQIKSEQDIVKQNIRTQLTNLGMPYDVAKQNIDLLTSFYDAQIKRYGNEDAKKIVNAYIGNLEANRQQFQKQPFGQIEDLDLFIDKARRPIKQTKSSKPLLKSLKEMGGVKIGSNLAGELNAIGINTKTAPALFKKNGGIGDVDNIPLSEFQDKFPNIQATPDETGSYVDRQFLLDLLSNEAFGEDISQVKSEDQKQIENFLEELDKAGIDINLPNEDIKKAIRDYQGYSQTKNQTQTPAFKKWFSDSKVVDKDGKPLVVYHGSNATFDTFDIKKIGQTATAEGYGFYLTDNKDIAKGYQRDDGSLIEAYASMQKPLDSKAKPFNAKQISTILNKMVDIEVKKFKDEITDYKDSFLSNFVDTYSLSKAQAIKETAQMLVEGNDTAIDQISELSNVVGDKTTAPEAIKETLGFDGVVVKDFQQGEGTVYLTWFPNQIKSIENKGTFDPNNPNIYFQNEAQPQGQTQFIGQKPIITLFEKADRSTLLHELGHTFLQIQADLAKLPNMPEQFQKDWGVIEKFLDIKDGFITREAHEQFARTFEAYLREGKAPSVQLRDSFRRFKAWLLNIYKDVLQLDTKINKDIRGVFDRMLATDEQIELNRNSPLFKIDNNVLELLTKAERDDYIKRTEESKERTKEILLRKALKQMAKKQTQEYREARQKTRDEIEQEMNKDKTFRTLHFLKTGKILGEDTELKPIKLSREDVKNYDGEFIKYLPKGIFGKDGVPVEMVADEFGFKNGSDMLFALANAKNFKEELELATDQEMINRYGDMLFDGSLEREALESSENEAVANKIVYELEAVNRKVRTITESKEAYKAKASEIFASKKVSEATDVNRYYINGLKAARESGKYLGKKDYEKAVEWKKKQLLNHYLFQEANKFKKELTQANRSYKVVKQKPSRNKVALDESFRLKALNVLQDFGLAEKTDDYVKTDINELEQWKRQKQSEEGILGLVEFPEIANFQNKTIKELTTEEFRILNDSIQNLIQTGRDLRMIEVNGKRYEINTLASEISETIKKGKKLKPVIIGTKTRVEKLIDGFDEYTSTLTKAKLKAELLDGKEFGNFYNTIIDPVAQGELVRNERTKEALDKYEEIYRKYFGKKGIDRKRVYTSNGKQFSKESIIALALNWGTETNRKRIIDGFQMNDVEVMNLMSKLDKNELQFAQELLDYLGTFWEETSTLNKKLYGFSPKKEKNVSFSVISADGQKIDMAGGYYPIAYAENYSDISALESIGYSKAVSFDKSYLKERTNQKVDKQLELTLIPAIQHISDVVSDLSIKEASYNSFKILNNRKVKKAILETEGMGTFNIFNSWIKDLFGNGRTSSSTFGRILDHLRAGTVISAMGAKVSTTVMQISGFPQSIVKIGYVNMAKGLLKFIGNPLGINKSYNFALEKSKILKSRDSGYNRDVYDVLKIMEGKGKISRNLVNIYFYPMSKMQMMVDLPTWYGAYYKGLKDFKDDDKAVKYADKIVVQSQGSGLLQDLSGFERGSVGGLTKSNLIKLFTPFMTYFNAKYNLALESYKTTDFKKPSNVAKFTSDILLLYLIEGLIAQFVLGKIPDFDEEDEDSATVYAFKQMADNYFAQFPIIRETYAGFKGFDVAPAGLSGLKSITQGIGQIKTGLSEDEIDINKISQGINQAGGVLLHYPSGQVDVFLEALDRSQEEDVSPVDYLIKPPRK